MSSGILGKASLAAAVNTVLYTVPANKLASFGINVVNLSGSAVSVRVALASSATPTAADYLEYGAAIPANGVLERTGLVAQSGTVVVIYSSAADVAAVVYGYEE